MVVVGLGAPALGQFQDRSEAKGPRIGEPSTQRWQLGVTITADTGPCSGLVGYVPLFVDWPEQQATVIAEDVTPNVRLTYQTVDGIKVMLVNVPNLPAGEQAKALITFEVKRSPMAPPQDTTIYQLPNPKKLPKEVRPYLAPSPGIESKTPKFRALVKEIAGSEESAWKKVELLYDWVRNHVTYEKGQAAGAMAAVKAGKGNTDDLTSVFIALCRTMDVPARTVWVPGHCYPEFYLVDDEGRGHWFPCEMKESRSFGGITEQRPVLMKGDNFRPPYAPRDRQRMLSEYLTGAGGKPKSRFVRQSVN
jgi:hypothetical protein